MTNATANAEKLRKALRKAKPWDQAMESTEKQEAFDASSKSWVKVLNEAASEVPEKLAEAIADALEEASGIESEWGDEPGTAEICDHLLAAIGCAGVDATVTEVINLFRGKLVVAETMPDHLRDSHRAAGNWGSYPHNGAERGLAYRDAIDADDEYDRIIVDFAV